MIDCSDAIVRFQACSGRIRSASFGDKGFWDHALCLEQGFCCCGEVEA